MIEGMTIVDAVAWLERRGVSAESAVALRALVEEVTVEYHRRHDVEG